MTTDLVLAVAGLATPAQAGVITHDAFPPGPTVTAVIIHAAADVPPTTQAVGPEI
ncbi:hypothetical protein ACQP1P_16055 [Dactylosporangium sp. CA-052675]|uniref:hypothetical protein n=1 Tax=Dactylosporangium sp. CA-052675 TaxID=3239927 RepID=UPI003D8C56B0